MSGYWCGTSQAAVEVIYGKIGEWDTSRVLDMSEAFHDRECDQKLRNVTIGGWNTSSVTNMKVSKEGALPCTDRCHLVRLALALKWLRGPAQSAHRVNFKHKEEHCKGRILRLKYA